MNSIPFLDGCFTARPRGDRLLLWVIAFACLPHGVRADLRLVFNVVLETATPASAAPKSAATHSTRDFALTVVLGEEYFTSVGDETTSLIDFAERKVHRLNPRDQSYQTFSLYADLGFRAAEFRNRLMQQKVLAAGGIKENPFETVLTEHLFSLRAPDAPTLRPTDTSDALAFSHGGKPLFACTAGGTPVSALEAKHFVRFLRYAYAMHPDILTALEERRRIPVEFDVHRYNLKTEHYRFKLVKAEPVSRLWEPEKTMAGMKLQESPVGPLCVLADAISRQQFDQRCAELVHAAVRASDAGHYLDSLLLFLEYAISSGRPLPKESAACMERIQNDSEVKGFLGALQPRGKEAGQKSADTMRQLQSSTRKGRPVLKIHEANFLTAAGKPEEAKRLFREALRESPTIVGAWKDLGDLYYKSFEAALAWQCWDAGRRIFPDHPLFKKVGEFERKLVADHPEFFAAEFVRSSTPVITRRSETPGKAAPTPAPARGKANAAAQAPTTAAGYNSRGLAKQNKGDFDGAIGDYDLAVRIDPTYSTAWINRANARHAKGDFEGALTDYARRIADAKDHAPYARLFRYLIERRLQRGDPNTELARDAVNWTHPWTKTVAGFLTGQMMEADLHAAAIRGSGNTPQALPCESYYFAGMQALLSGEVERARGLFEKCVGTNATGRLVLLFARAELARLPAMTSSLATGVSLQEGQCWSYAARPGEAASFLVIRKIETIPNRGEVVHISVFEVKIKNTKSPTGYAEQVAHLPLAGASLRASLKEQVQKTVPRVDWQLGYRSWLQAKGGVFTKPVSECVAFAEEMMNRANKG